MIIKVGIWKNNRKSTNINKNDEILSYEVERFSGKGFKTRLIRKIKDVDNKINNLKKKDIICVGVDLIYNGKLYKGGCLVSYRTLKDSKRHFLDITIAQLIKQIKTTLEELEK